MEQRRADADKLQAGEKRDCFGLWLGPADEPNAPPRPQAPAGSGNAPEDLAAIRAFRAGKGPLASVVRSPAVAGATVVPRPESAAPDAPRAEGFRSLEKPTLFLLLGVAGLLVAGTYAVRAELRSIGGLEVLERQNARIQEYNQSRNILVQHLAKDRPGQVTRLPSYAQWADHKAGGGRGVIVFRPGGGDRQDAIRVDLADPPPEAPGEIEPVQSWTPPPPIQDYNRNRFSRAELIASRLPTAATLLLVVLGLAGWAALAYRNLPALQAETSFRRPGLTALCWFIPGLNVYLPAAVMSEIWRGSDPRQLHRPRSLGPPVVALWWLALLGTTGMVGYAFWRMADAVGITAMVRASKVNLYADICALGVGLLTGVLVVAVCWNQHRRGCLSERLPLRAPLRADAWGLD